jgi:hypothetical protein
MIIQTIPTLMVQWQWLAALEQGVDRYEQMIKEVR